jgi:hypothetical protein
VRTVRSSTLALVAACAACERVDVAVELNFPSSEALLRGETVDLYAVPIAAHESDICPALLGEALVSAPEGAVVLGRATASCAWLTGVRMKAPAGALAYVAVVRDSTGQALLSGCNASMGDALHGVRIVLAPTASLLIQVRAEIEQGTPPASDLTPEQICAQRGLP